MTSRKSLHTLAINPSAKTGRAKDFASTPCFPHMMWQICDKMHAATSITNCDSSMHLCVCLMHVYEPQCIRPRIGAVSTGKAANRPPLQTLTPYAKGAWLKPSAFVQCSDNQQIRARHGPTQEDQSCLLTGPAKAGGHFSCHGHIPCHVSGNHKGLTATFLA